jgi:hypothetical protein
MKKFFSKNPFIVVLLVFIVFLFIFWKKILSYFKNEPDVDTSKLSDVEHQVITDQLWSAMKKMGTDEQEIWDLLRKLNSDDLIYIYNLFGKKSYIMGTGEESFFGTEEDLITILKNELTNSEEPRIKFLFRNTGLWY